MGFFFLNVGCTKHKFLFLTEDTVHIPFEDQREEYVQKDSGLLFMGTAKNMVSRPWSFDQVWKWKSVDQDFFSAIVQLEKKSWGH